MVLTEKPDPKGTPRPVMEECPCGVAVLFNGCSAEYWDILSQETLGSVSDVFDAIGDMLAEAGVQRDDAIQLCERVFDALTVDACHVPKRTRTASTTESDATNDLAADMGVSELDRLAWRREFKSHAERFEAPYHYPLMECVPHAPHQVLELQQKYWDTGAAGGFASSVWVSHQTHPLSGLTLSHPYERTHTL